MLCKGAEVPLNVHGEVVDFFHLSCLLGGAPSVHPRPVVPVTAVGIRGVIPNRGGVLVIIVLNGACSLGHLISSFIAMDACMGRDLKEGDVLTVLRPVEQ
jgi:hypothetical protein